MLAFGSLATLGGSSGRLFVVRLGFFFRRPSARGTGLCGIHPAHLLEFFPLATTAPSLRSFACVDDYAVDVLPPSDPSPRVLALFLGAPLLGSGSSVVCFSVNFALLLGCFRLFPV